MKKKFLLPAIIGFGIIAILTACASAPVSPTPAVDTVATTVFQQVFFPLTQTASAASPTPTITSTPTITPIPRFTKTPEPKSTVNFVPLKLKRTVVTTFAACWKGPGPQYTLISNISEKKYVEILGAGNVPGWVVIRNPYFHNPCWIETIYLRIDPNLKIENLPVMTPSP
jgi:hypothetical protein